MKKYMPLNGLRWSRDSGSALCGVPQTVVLGQAGGLLKSAKKKKSRKSCDLQDSVRRERDFIPLYHLL